MNRLSVIAGSSLVVFLFASAATAQTTREDWKALDHAYDVAVRFSGPLEDLRLTSRERAQIYRVLRVRLLQGTPTPEQRRNILSARAGALKLTRDGNKQVAVQAPSAYCGATGNCLVWIFYQKHGSMHLALQTQASVVMAKETSTRGFKDLATYENVSAAEGGFNIYRWDGGSYKKIDCYQVKFNLEDRAIPPEILECPK